VDSVDSAVLQAALNALCLWADKWQLTAVVDKCCVCSLHTGKADKTPTVYLSDNVALPAVLFCRDFGITITHDLSSCMHYVGYTYVGKPTVAQLVERRSLTGELSLSYALPAADG